jgi:hypothetical protein
VALSCISFIACRTDGLSRWRQVDYYAYKVTRLIAGRRIAGSAWMPASDGEIVRVSNATAHVAVSWFLDRAAEALEASTKGDRRPVLLPFPGSNRVVGSPPSGSRNLAQELAGRTGLRVLDVLRWRQRMPSCQPPELQHFLDNLISTGSPIRTDCILITDLATSSVPLQAAATRLRQMGSIVTFAIAAGRVVRQPPEDPFTAEVATIDDLATVTS